MFAGTSRVVLPESQAQVSCGSFYLTQLFCSLSRAQSTYSAATKHQPHFCSRQSQGCSFCWGGSSNFFAISQMGGIVFLKRGSSAVGLEGSCVFLDSIKHPGAMEHKPRTAWFPTQQPCLLWMPGLEDLLCICPLLQVNKLKYPSIQGHYKLNS